MPWDLTARGPHILNLLMPGFSQELSQVGAERRGRRCQAVVKTSLLWGFLSKGRVVKEIWSAPGDQVLRTCSEQALGEGTRGATDPFDSCSSSFTQKDMGEDGPCPEVVASEQGEGLDAEI